MREQIRQLARHLIRLFKSKDGTPHWFRIVLGIVTVLFLIVPLLFVYLSKPAERRVTFLAVNDIYRLDGLSEGREGGLHRLRTLRRQIEQDAPNAILLHAGDFLSPSLISKIFFGEQMIDVMNHLDGDGPAFDHRMFVAIGNHEFDDSRCDKEPAPLNRRIDESKFIWLAANLDFSSCPSMKMLSSHPNVRRDGIIVEIGRVKVGIFGIALTPDKEGAPKYPRFEEPAIAVRRSIENLRHRGAQLIVALTHLPKEDDNALIRDFASKDPKERLDLLVGGHDHEKMVLKDAAGNARGFKADSDARTAWRIDVYLSGGVVSRIVPLSHDLDERIPPDAKVSELADLWFRAAAKAICADRRKKDEPENPSCLTKKIGRTATTIELEESVNRNQETGIGNWIADLMMETTEADVAIINSGNLGLNENLQPGSELQLKHVVDMFRFDDVVAIRKFPAKLVCEALSHGFTHPGRGAWPHIGGAEIDIKQLPVGGNAATVRRLLKRADLTCESDAEIKVASVPFLLCGGDGYPFKADSHTNCVKAVQDDPFEERFNKVRARRMLSDVVEAKIRDAGEDGIKPVKDGRIRLTP